MQKVPPTSSLLASFEPRRDIAFIALSQTPWIIDYGVSSHMTSNVNLFIILDRYAYHPLDTTADGTFALIFDIGIVHINHYLTLLYVLYVPKFPINLLFVFALTRTLSCTVIIYLSSCLFHDLKIKKAIGGGHEADGVNLLTNEQSTISTTLSTTVTPY